MKSPHMPPAVRSIALVFLWGMTSLLTAQTDLPAFGPVFLQDEVAILEITMDSDSAEAMLFGTLGCRSNKTIADVKLVSTSTGAALWTAHGENADPSTMAKYVLHELRALDKQP